MCPAGSSTRAISERESDAGLLAVSALGPATIRALLAGSVAGRATVRALLAGPRGVGAAVCALLAGPRGVGAAVCALLAGCFLRAVTRPWPAAASGSRSAPR